MVKLILQPDRDLLGTWTEDGIPDDPSTRQHALDALLRLWVSHQELESTLREIITKVRPTCDEFRADEGGAHHWCRVCGWRRDLHTEPVSDDQLTLDLKETT